MQCTSAAKVMGTLAAIALPLATLPQPAAAQNLSFTFINGSGVTLTDLYLVPSYSDTWQGDILDSDLLPGDSGTVSVQDGLTTCVYDIAGDFADGSEFNDYEVDLCELSSYTIY